MMKDHLTLENLGRVGLTMMIAGCLLGLDGLLLLIASEAPREPFAGWLGFNATCALLGIGALLVAIWSVRELWRDF